MEELFAELKLQLRPLVEALFDAAKVFVRKRGFFMPHGAVLAAGGEVRMVMAAPGDIGASSAADVLALLHGGMVESARQEDLAAVAVCEDVTIRESGQKATKAIKVLVEHRRGLTVAFYLPWKKKLFGGPAFGEVMAVAAEPEVRPWGDGGSV